MDELRYASAWTGYLCSNPHIDTRSTKMADEAGILRSAAQSRVQLYIPYETAHDTVKALGEVGLFQPEDLSEDAKHTQGGQERLQRDAD